MWGPIPGAGADQGDVEEAGEARTPGTPAAPCFSQHQDTQSEDSLPVSPFYSEC